MMKRKRRRGHVVSYSDNNSSPIGAFEPRQYSTAALEAYTMWCAARYNDDEFREVYQHLHKEKIGVDLIDEMEVEDLKKVCSLTHGTAVRLKKDFAKWKASL
jgi:hypothetical protein